MIIDFDKLNRLTTEINDRYKEITKLFAAENDYILKHLASSAIHMTLFRRDLHEIWTGTKIPTMEQPLENKFLNECGCKFNK